MPESDTALILRVRKLLDKAEGTDNPHEAEAFAQKAAELVARHRIDPDVLAASIGENNLAIVEFSLGRGAYVRARLALLGAVAEAHDVRVVFQPTPTGTIAYAAGHRADLDVVEVMYQSLHQQASAQMALIKRGTGAATQRYRRSFLFGYAARIGEILTETRQHVESAADRATGGETSLVLRERSGQVDDFVKRSWGKVRSASAPSAVLVDGWSSGVAAADRADVGRTRLGGRRTLDGGGR